MSAPNCASSRSAPIYGDALRLTLKQERFAILIADGLNASSSYRSTYNTKEMKPQTVWREAHRLRWNARVAQRIDQLRQAHEDPDRISRSSIKRRVIEALEALMLTSRSDMSKVKAAKILGRSVGLFDQRD